MCYETLFCMIKARKLKKLHHLGKASDWNMKSMH